MSPRPAPDSDILAGDAARCMFPGVVAAQQEAVAAAPAARDLTAEMELQLLLLIRKLQAVKTYPGSGDLAFIQNMRRRRPASLSVDERDRLLDLSWTYRAQLPEFLRAKTNRKLMEQNNA